MNNNIPETWIIDSDAKACSECKKRRSAFRTNLYCENGIGDARCYFCLALSYTDGSSNPQLFSSIDALYTDGGLLAMNRLGGVWAWCGVVTSCNLRITSGQGTVLQEKLGQVVTNNHTEQIAIIRAMEAMPEGWSGTIYSDSDIAIGRVFDNYGTKNLPDLIIERSRNARRRLGKVRAVLLQGHPTENDLIAGVGERRGYPVSIHNHFADISCEEEKRLYYEQQSN